MAATGRARTRASVRLATARVRKRTVAAGRMVSVGVDGSHPVATSFAVPSSPALSINFAGRTAVVQLASSGGVALTVVACPRLKRCRDMKWTANSMADFAASPLFVNAHCRPSLGAGHCAIGNYFVAMVEPVVKVSPVSENSIEKQSNNANK
jgi:hypothetical protein